MPHIRDYHRNRAQFERKMADDSATNMARIIHKKLADMHSSALDAAAVVVPSVPWKN